MNIWAVLVAAGSGVRFGAPKHALDLHGRAVWEWGRDALLGGGVDEVIVVGEVPGGVPGGATRRESVAGGLARVPDTATHIVVHDAARPLASAALVAEVIAVLREGASAVVPAVAVPDTIKRVEGSQVQATVDRRGLVLVQTPQGFVASVLREAHASSREAATDDASLVEAMGVAVRVIEGSPHNVKITYPDDLVLVRALAGRDVR